VRREGTILSSPLRSSPVDLLNGRAIAAFRSTGFKRLDKLYVAVKLLWKKVLIYERENKPCFSPEIAHI
jgi:hypothetical protein